MTPREAQKAQRDKIEGRSALPWEGESTLPARGRLTSNADAERFMLAGMATVTFVSKKTGVRYTFRIRDTDREGFWFVDTLKGSDNVNDFGYIGQIVGTQVRRYMRGHKCWPVYYSISDIFAWCWHQITMAGQEIHPDLEVWHEGRCGRCGRKLTVPESIESGFGPECRGLV